MDSVLQTPGRPPRRRVHDDVGSLLRYVDLANSETLPSAIDAAITTATVTDSSASSWPTSVRTSCHPVRFHSNPTRSGPRTVHVARLSHVLGFLVAERCLAVVLGVCCAAVRPQGSPVDRFRLCLLWPEHVRVGHIRSFGMADHPREIHARSRR